MSIVYLSLIHQRSDTMEKIHIHNDSDTRKIKIHLWEGSEKEEHTLIIDNLEYGFILLNGEAIVETDNNTYHLGYRSNPIDDKGDILLLSSSQNIRILSLHPNTRLMIIRVPTKNSYPDQFIASKDIRESVRGKNNWERKVRLGLWSDNSDGESLLIGETIVPPGNWSAMPAHRHDTYKQDNNGISQVPYQELYFFQFPVTTGYSLCKIFDEELSHIYEVKNNEAIFIGKGYHTVVNSPLSQLYHLTIMSGVHRQSTAEVHEDYYPLLEENTNPYRNQEKKVGIGGK